MVDTRQSKKKTPQEKLGLPETKDIFKPTPTLGQSPAVNLPQKGEDPQVFRDERGKIGGVETEKGTFLGIDRQIAEELIRRQAETQATPLGAEEASEVARREALQRQGLELAGGVGQLDPNIVGQAGTTELDLLEAAQAGIGGIAPAAIGGAVTGATLGAVATAPAGGAGAIPVAVALAAAGAVQGFLSSARSNLKSQKGDLFQASTQSLSERQTILNDLISDTNTNPQNANENLGLFNQQLSLIRKEYNSLKLESQSSATKLLDAGTRDDMIEYEVYYQGVEDRVIADFQSALLNPNPAISRISNDRVQEILANGR